MTKRNLISLLLLVFNLSMIPRDAYADTLCTAHSGDTGYGYVNIVRNGNFEFGFTGASGDRYGIGWNIDMKSDPDRLYLENDGFNTQSFVVSGIQSQITQLGHSVTTGHNYRASMRVKWNGASAATLKIKVKYKDSNDNWVTLVNFTDVTVPNTGGNWRDYGFDDFFIKSAVGSSSEAVIFVIFNGNGTLIMDDIVIQDLDKPRIHGTVYMDAYSGNDVVNEGCSESASWRSLEHLATYDVLPGSSILFKRGSSWRGSLTAFSGSVGANKHITYGAYGNSSLAKPVFVGSVPKNSTSDWAPTSALNVWSTPITLNSNNKCPAFIMLGDMKQSNVGTFVYPVEGLTPIELEHFDTVMDADKNFECDFTLGDESINVYSTAVNPATKYGSIELAERQYGMHLEQKEYILMSNLAFVYYSGFALFAESSHNLIFDNITAAYIGGQFGIGNNPDDNVRSGAGISTAGDATRDIIISNCDIWQVLDNGVGIQLFELEAETAKDILIYKCKIDRSGGGIKAGIHKAVAGSVMENIYIVDNDIYNSGYGWSGVFESNPHGTGITVLETAAEQNDGPQGEVKGIYIHDNLIDSFTFWGIGIRQGAVEISDNIIQNGIGVYTGASGTTHPAGIGISGLDPSANGQSAYEVSGKVFGNTIINNQNMDGIYVKNNTPYFNSETLKIYNNTLTNNGMDLTGNSTLYAGFNSENSSGTLFYGNVINNTNSIVMVTKPLTNFIYTTWSDNNNFHRAVGGTVWVWGSTNYNISDFGQYKSDTQQDLNSTAW